MPIYFATCETAAATEIKAVSIPTLINLQPGIEISIMFTNVNSYGSCVGTESNIIADGPKISLNGGTAYPIKIGGEPAGEGFNRAGDIHKFVFDGAAWNDLTTDVIYQGETEVGNYVKKRNGFLIENLHFYDNTAYKIYTIPICYSNVNFNAFSQFRAASASYGNYATIHIVSNNTIELANWNHVTSHQGEIRNSVLLIGS